MKNKGFTLVELLATIVIVAIIMGIVLPSASRISSENKDEIYHKYEDMMIEYAEVNSHRDDYIITLQDLEDLQKIKTECKGYVLIDHNSNPVYQPYICCGSDDTGNACNNYTYKTEGYNPTNLDGVPIPRCKNNVIYDGTPQVLVNTSSAYTLTNEKRTVVGEQNVNASLVDKGVTSFWIDKSHDDKVIRKCKVRPRPITVTAHSEEKVYDRTALTANNECDVDNLATGHHVVCTGNTGTITNVGVSEKKVGEVRVYDSANKDVTGNYEITKVSGTLKIIPKTITATVSASNKVYNGNTNATCSNTASLTGVISGDTVTASVNTSGTFDNKDVGNSRVVTCTNVTLGGASASNYVLEKTSVTTTANITPRTLTVTAANKSKTYGNTNPSLTYSYSGQVSGETPAFNGALTTSATSSSAVGTYDITKGTLALKDNGAFKANNYTLSYTKGTLTINKRTLTVTAADKSKTYGDANPSLTYTYSGQVSGQTPGFSGALTTSATASSAVGTYDITQGTLALKDNGTFKVSNYSMSYTKATLTINKRTLTVTAANKSKTYGDANPSLTYTYSGQVSGQTPGFSGAITTSATASSAVGSYDITQGTLALKDNGTFKTSNYTLSYTKGTLTINRRTLTVTAADKSKTYGDANPSLTYSYSGQVSGQTPAFSGAITTSATASSGAGTYDITQGTLALKDNGTFKANNYSISYTKGTLTVGKKTLSVTAADKSKTYGDANPSLTYSYSGQVSGQTPAFSGAITTSATASSGAGTYDITQGTLALKDNGTFKANNYSISYTKGTLTVGKKTLSVTAANKSKTYGDANPSLTYSYSGQVSGQTPAFSGAITTSATASSAVGTYDITQGTLALKDNGTFKTSNYSISYTKGTLTVGKKTLSVTADNKSKTYGTDNPSLTYTYSGQLSGETPAFSGALTTSAGKNSDVGSYDITQGTLALKDNGTFKTSNYSMSYTKGTLSIIKGSSTNPTLTSVEVTDDGKAHAIGVSGGSGGTIYYRTSSDNNNWSSWSITVPTRTSVGTTYVRAYVKGDKNHNDTSETGSKTIKINSAIVTITCPGNATSYQEYTGSEITYAGNTCPTGSTSNNAKGTNAGTYYGTCTANAGYQFASACTKATLVIYTTTTATNKVTSRTNSGSTSFTISGVYLSATATNGTVTCSQSGKIVSCSVSNMSSSAANTDALCNYANNRTDGYYYDGYCWKMVGNGFTLNSNTPNTKPNYCDENQGRCPNYEAGNNNNHLCCNDYTPCRAHGFHYNGTTVSCQCWGHDGSNVYYTGSVTIKYR